MTIYPKKNGRGYVTTYQVIFGSKEARNLKLMDENGVVKQIADACIVANDVIQIKLK